MRRNRRPQCRIKTAGLNYNMQKVALWPGEFKCHLAPAAQPMVEAALGLAADGLSSRSE